MRALLRLFVVFHAGILFSQTGTVAESPLVAAGIPALTREWAGADYMQAAKVLAQGQVPLPRLSDEPGRLFLQRLTNTGNLSRYQDRTLPLEKRIPDFFNLMTGSIGISKLYLDATKNGLEVHPEFVRQMAFQLRFAAMGVQLLDEYVPTIPKDEKYDTRMAGLKRAYGGLMKMFAATADSLAETDRYSPADLTLLLTTMAETLPLVKKALPADFKLDLRKKLEPHRTTVPNPEGVKAIQQMIDELGA